LYTYTHICRNTTFSGGRITTSFRVTGPLQFNIIEDGICVHLICSQYELESVCLKQEMCYNPSFNLHLKAKLYFMPLLQLLPQKANDQLA